MPSQMLQRSL